MYMYMYLIHSRFNITSPLLSLIKPLLNEYGDAPIASNLVRNVRKLPNTSLIGQRQGGVSTRAATVMVRYYSWLALLSDKSR